MHKDKTGNLENKQFFLAHEWLLATFQDRLHIFYLEWVKCVALS